MLCRMTLCTGPRIIAATTAMFRLLELPAELAALVRGDDRARSRVAAAASASRRRWDSQHLLPARSAGGAAADFGAITSERFACLDQCLITRRKKVFTSLLR